MNRAEVYAFIGAILLGIAIACAKPSLPAFIGWPACTLSVVLILAAVGRLQ